MYKKTFVSQNKNISKMPGRPFDLIVGELLLTGAAAREAGAIGALALDSNEAVNTYSLLQACCAGFCPDTGTADCTWASVDRETCCFSRDDFYVPFPGSCCAVDFACCPSSPRGEAWEAALANGFGPLLAEAGPLAHSIKLSYPDYRALAELAHARAVLLNTHWVPRANAVLSRSGLRVAAFSYAFVKPQSNGWGGWSSRCVLQFYDNAIAAQRRGTADMTGAAKTTLRAL